MEMLKIDETATVAELNKTLEHLAKLYETEGSSESILEMVQSVTKLILHKCETYVVKDTTAHHSQFYQCASGDGNIIKPGQICFNSARGMICAECVEREKLYERVA